MPVAWQSQFHGILDHRHVAPEGELSKGIAEPALPGRRCRPLEGVTRRRRGAGVYLMMMTVRTVRMAV